jgi:hypothetical protein
MSSWVRLLVPVTTVIPKVWPLLAKVSTLLMEAVGEIEDVPLEDVLLEDMLLEELGPMDDLAWLVELAKLLLCPIDESVELVPIDEEELIDQDNREFEV